MYGIPTCAILWHVRDWTRGGTLSSNVNLPTGTVTLLLADVEGSTRMWQRDTVEARSAMAELDVLADELVAKFDGARPLEQGEGDSFVAAFSRPSDALACALEIQRRLSESPVRLRMGLNTGEVEIRDGERYDGPTIIRAARLRDLGHGGQVLVSMATRDVVRDGLPDGAELIDLGTHPLRDLDRPEHVYQLAHSSLPSRFPALRSQELAKGNLPIRLTSFVGRNRELIDVQRLVQAHRLVTLTGAGGCGKTRLAIEACARMTDRFPDGVWFCDVGPLADPDAVAQTLSAAVGVRAGADTTETDAVCVRLKGWQALVVLDNCEHLIPACVDLVDALVRECPSVCVLTTSREPLGIDGEVAWRVPSLDAPQQDVTIDPEAAAGFEAVQLFVERAATARPNFALTPENVPAVAEICSRLDGIPLALELAAARIRVISVNQIATGLSDRFRLLGRGARSLLPRQQTLEASVAWSHDLLSAPQQVLLRRLSVFAGGFTLEAAEHVASGDGIEVDEVLELLSQLVDRSLIVSEESPDGRYRMLETIRQFARERLVEAEEVPGVSSRHLDWYALWLTTVFEPLDSAWSDSFGLAEEEYENIRLACEWAIANDRPESGLRILAALNDFLVWAPSIGRIREVRDWGRKLLSTGPVAETALRAGGLITLSIAELLLGNESGAIEAADQAVTMAEDAGDEGLRVKALERRAASGATSDRAEIRQLEAALEQARAAADWHTAGLCLAVLGLRLADYGEIASAQHRLEEAVSVTDDVFITTGATYMGVGLRWLRGGLSMEEFETIRPSFDAEIPRVGAYWLPIVLGFMATPYRLIGDSKEARARAERALAVADEIGIQVTATLARAQLARLELSEGRITAAMSLIDEATASLAVTPVLRTDAARADLDSVRALALWSSGDIAAARAALGDWSAELYGGFTSGLTLVVPALVARAAEEPAEAEALISEGLRKIADTGAIVFAPDALEMLACIRTDTGADTDSVRLFAAAAAGRARSGFVRSVDLLPDAEEQVAALRNTLGEPAFAEAWTEGEGLSLEDAIAFALRGRGPRHRPQAGWDAITPTEAKVIDLVAEGLSNPQIAEKLFISRRTVSTHLSHVFAKLGVSSRAELATAATKRGI
jgi:predicted ATPase/class 3 adenylate cyclase/DNA-binding CsgD family transcriptional regulator